MHRLIHRISNQVLQVNQNSHPFSTAILPILFPMPTCDSSDESDPLLLEKLPRFSWKFLTKIVSKHEGWISGNSKHKTPQKKIEDTWTDCDFECCIGCTPKMRVYVRLFMAEIWWTTKLFTCARHNSKKSRLEQDIVTMHHFKDHKNMSVHIIWYMKAYEGMDDMTTFFWKRLDPYRTGHRFF